MVKSALVTGELKRIEKYKYKYGDNRHIDHY